MYISPKFLLTNKLKIKNRFDKAKNNTQKNENQRAFANSFCENNEKTQKK